ncbi:hypothetical protein ACSMEV_20490 [Pseudomonas sp. MLB6B]
MKRQRGMVLLVCLVLTLLMSMLAASALNDALLETRLAGHLLSRAQAFEQAEATLLEASAVLDKVIVECPACLPPARPYALEGRWQRGRDGFFSVQDLGVTERAAHMPPGEPVRLFRITAVSAQPAARQVLEAVYAFSLDYPDFPQRILWRHRAQES